ncbi:TetR/AcrR family transcriptional regulator [Schumannella sp. 10F1B-5-1]|uniref:TetR/AcrR family transcriptional regulator n=1 Tax=Schumannella sp. 10F1B-5-1 TaxID=2590780 RepID=UPI0011321A50|nr:TetR/AcrR family transcriptional regulator [Schumannella sp. 10F1B-5-1]TPW71501.1 TetR/AcrR family transcriptional regulator [Schumannella sp. 10F1B-5-1]
MPADSAASAARTASAARATDAATTPGPRAASTRERILDAATARFYEQGIRATSADRVIDDVGITKVTFYRHFRTKSDLVVAYLQRQAEGEREWMRTARSDGDPVASLHALAAGIGAASCRPGFRGCPFINAAAEFADADDPVRAAVEEHRRWTAEEFAAIATEADVDDPEAVAGQLQLLRDGAMVNGYLSDPAAIAGALDAAFTAVLARASGHDSARSANTQEK